MAEVDVHQGGKDIWYQGVEGSPRRVGCPLTRGQRRFTWCLEKDREPPGQTLTGLIGGTDTYTKDVSIREKYHYRVMGQERQKDGPQVSP